MRGTDGLNRDARPSTDFARFQGESDNEYLHRLLLLRMLHASVSLPAKSICAEITKVMEQMGLHWTLAPEPPGTR